MDEVPLEISIEELDRMRNEGEPHTLLDIREPHELRISALSGSLDIPMGSVSERLDELPREGTIAVLCRTGNRSMKVTMWLRAAGLRGRDQCRRRDQRLGGKDRSVFAAVLRCGTCDTLGVTGSHALTGSS